jgi:hypothetical protein
LVCLPEAAAGHTGATDGHISPTAPLVVPEPFMYQAMFLMDAADDQVVARKLYCVIY